MKNYHHEVETLIAELQDRMDENQFSTLAAFIQPAAIADNNILTKNFSGCGRRFKMIQADKTGKGYQRWPTEKLARCTLATLAIANRKPTDAAFLLDDLFRKGDLHEQEAVLTTLNFFPDRSEFMDIAFEALRSNVVPVFASICCDNDYPAARFSELNFNQMVLKALFLDIEVARIDGLKERLNPQLLQMISDYRDERTIANRSVPEGIGFIESLNSGVNL